MAVKIVDVDLLQTTKTSQSIKIEVEVTEGAWGSVKELLPSWNFVINKFSNWDGLIKW